ncbi:hypothetical protein Sulac_3549 (plasmid) [Sulfobacillus acidophilus DSM 10332]|uniref:Uncharacterized protein n=1 Tax=Sulfobacillus acidophilus (strain ATCC 700253 / DSM 10332 / NAL) TaxID=679936 RepID=G8U1Q4_SULAD|nr:hypothetical protein Sulac_3549 [Sulfobacillus acidophilus DSM 10332]
MTLVATPADIRRQMVRLGFIASDEQLCITPTQLAGKRMPHFSWKLKLAIPMALWFTREV